MRRGGHNLREVLPIARRGFGGHSATRVASPHATATRLAVVGVLGVVVFSVLFLRLWALTVLSGSHYVEQAQANTVRELPVEAPRGAIVDRHGNPLVTNKAAREVVLYLKDVRPEDREQLYRNLARVLDRRPRDVKRAVVKAGGDRDPLTPVVVSKDVVEDSVVFYLEEHRTEFPGVQVRERYVRNYVDGAIGAHIFGQVGEVSAEQLDGDFANLKPGDRVGQNGVERQYDEYLRGKDGYRAIEVDAAGVPRGVGRGNPPSPGNNLRLSIDMGLQKATENGVKEGIRIAHRDKDGRNANAGAAVAIDPRNGEVLALASYPDYDPNIFVTRGNDDVIEQVLNDERTPLSNRAVSGLYPPGSIFKPVTALAAMSEGFVTADTLINCPPFKEIAGTKFNNWTDEHMGMLNLAQALEVSCDTYFYELALDFYNTPGSRLQGWAARFGLGTATGIDLPGEADGLIPTPEWRKRTFEGWGSVWSPGHSVNLSIGQGDLLVTPLQMTVLYGALANGGTVYEPRLARGIEDPGGRTMVRLSGVSSSKLPVNKEMLRPVRDGLYRSGHTGNGTASAVFQSFEIPVSGKTGTAEKPPHGDMAWYCGYAPAHRPTIAACALIEAGGHGGTSAAPVVLRMFQHYFSAKGGNATGAKESETD